MAEISVDIDSLSKEYLLKFTKSILTQSEAIQEAIDRMLEHYFSNGFHSGESELLGEEDATRIGEALDHHVTENIAESQSLNLGSAIVRTMSLSLSYWETTTGKYKIDLATESGQWKSTQTPHGYRTQTMDKYITGKGLPQNSAWRKVLAIASFVLENTQKIQIAGEYRSLIIKGINDIH